MVRGSRAPNACATSGATADIAPMPSTNTAKNIVCASDAAAIAASPSRPISARSVVIIAIWPSCVSAIGIASRIVSISSARMGRLAGAGAAALAMASDEDMAAKYLVL